MTAYIDNPFTILYDALWRMAFQSHLLQRLVKEGNRINYGSETNRDPVKEILASADVPCLALWPMGINGGNLHANSSSSQLIRNYGFVISTGDYRLHPYLHQIEFELVCALANWKSNLSQLVWQGIKFVKNANLLPSSVAPIDPQKSPGIAGWTSLWSCSVELWLPTDLLTANLKQEISQ